MGTFEELVLRLVEEANSLWVEYVPDNPEEYGKALSGNVAALHLLKQALALTNRKVRETRKRSKRRRRFGWNSLLMYSMSWELIPGLHSRQHSFTPLEATKSGDALQAALRREPRILFTGEKGQGKTFLARYTTQKLFMQTVYVDCRGTFDSSELAYLLLQLVKTIIVFDSPTHDTIEFVKYVLTETHGSNPICVIISSEDPYAAYLTAMTVEVRLENPSEFEIWRIKQRFASSFHGSYSDLPPCELKNRAAIVRNIQNYIIQSMALLGKVQAVNRQDPERKVDAVTVFRPANRGSSPRRMAGKVVKFVKSHRLG